MDFNPNTRTEEFFALPVSRFSRFYRTLTTPSGDTLRSFVDNTFKSKFEAALAAGIIVMPYHFFRSNLGGIAQARHCINTLTELGFFNSINYVPIIWFDVETSDGASVDSRRKKLLAALQEVEVKGFQGGVYSSPYYWNQLIGLVDWIANYWQWVAHWSSVSVPTLPLGWSREKTIVWQNGIHPAHSWVETVIGATGNVDHNYFYGNMQRLAKILQFPTTPPPNGDCNCEEEIARLEAEINSNKLEIYNLQQSMQGIVNEVNNNKTEISNLHQGQSTLDNDINEVDEAVKKIETFLDSWE
jgi:hypothetical protein